jgi:hypothetical protein
MFIKKAETMRTTLSIDDDVLNAAKGLAERQRLSVGEVISALARQALQPRSPPTPVRNGITLLAAGPNPSPVNLELVNQLRDEGS